MNEKLNGYHIALLIFMSQLDVTVFSVPRIIAENIGTNGWLGLILLSGVAIANIGLIQLIQRKGGGRSIFAIAEQSIPKLILWPIYLLLAALWITLGSFICKKYVLIYQMVSFPTTNANLLYFLIAVMAFYLLIKGIYNISKAITLFFFLTMSGVLFALYFRDQWELARLTPFLFKGASYGQTFKNWLEVYTIFIGYEIALFLIPFSSQKSMFKGVYIGHIMTTIHYLFITIIAFGYFSLGQLQAVMYPVLNLLSYIELPFINRLENLIFSLYLFSNLLSIVLYGWISLLALQRIFPKPKKYMLELVIIAVSCCVSFYPSILRDSELILRYALYAEVSIAFGLPLLLLLLLALQSRSLHAKEGAAS